MRRHFLLKKISVVVVLITTLGSMSCNKKLKEYNPSAVSGQDFYTTPGGFEALVNACYSYEKDWYGKQMGFALSEVGTDIWASASQELYPELGKYQNLQGTSQAITVEWQKLYAAVNMCNVGIAGVDDSGLPAATKLIRLAELKFLRAFFYWHIVETWGPTNFATTPTDGVLTTANKTSVEIIYAQIFKDLTDAIPLLPVTTADYGRVTKNAAQAFLARMYLTRGMYAEAIASAKAVEQSAQYSLLPKYSDLWTMANVKNAEVVYAVNYYTYTSPTSIILDITGNPNFPDADPILNQYGGNNGHLFFLMQYDNSRGMTRDVANGRPFRRWAPTLYFLNLFEAKDTRYAGSFQTLWKANTAAAADKASAPPPHRIAMNVGDTAIFVTRDEYPDAYRDITSYSNPALLTGGSLDIKDHFLIYDKSDIYDTTKGGRLVDFDHWPALTKLMDNTRSGPQDAFSSRDAVVIRYAEVLMILAEAYMQTGDQTNALVYLNKVRARAGATPATAADLSIDYILDERAREFAGEQLRWFDLKRTGKLIERVLAHNPNVADNIKPYHIFRPIPQSQIDAVSNKADFQQNPGYQ
jgi:hypothetical protein